MTPASVTRTIAALEEELGVQLFVRTTRQVSLTSDGAVFAARIEPAVAALEAARRELMNVHKADQGRLRINAPMSLGQQVLPQILSAFRELYPKIEVELSLTDQMLDIVEQILILRSAFPARHRISSQSGARSSRSSAFWWPLPVRPLLTSRIRVN